MIQSPLLRRNLAVHVNAIGGLDPSPSMRWAGAPIWLCGDKVDALFASRAMVDPRVDVEFGQGVR
jgi:hypothetical protein